MPISIGAIDHRRLVDGASDCCWLRSGGAMRETVTGCVAAAAWRLAVSDSCLGER